MNVPFLDLKIQYRAIKHEIDPAIQAVLDSTAFVLGKSVFDFEKAFAEAHQVRHCVAVGSGTAGNHMTLWALGIGAGDEVIIPANTFIATAWGATLCGARPVFVDCTPDSYTIDPAEIERAITPRTKAIVAVHLYGQPADIDALRSALRSLGYDSTSKGVFLHSTTGQKIFLLEDCAQAHAAEYNGKKVGGLSIAASFSFYPGKNLGAYGEGGAVTTDDDDLAKKFRMIRDHGAEQKYIHECYGHNYRMEGIQGAVLGIKLKHLNEWTEMRRTVAKKYGEALSGLSRVEPPVEKPYAKHVYHLYVVRAERRDDLQKFLLDHGVGTGLHYPMPLHVQPCFSSFGYKRGDFPNAERISDEGISLPMYAELTDEQIGYVVQKIKEFYAI